MSAPSPAARTRPAGDATNVVTDYVHVRGESRSHDGKFFKEITKAYKAAFEKAAKKVTNAQGKSGKVKFKAETDYFPFRMKDSQPVIKRAVEAVSAVGGTPNVRTANGGLDANWMVRHGVPTVTFGAGQNEAHTIDEWINLDEYDRACALAVQIATMRWDRRKGLAEPPRACSAAARWLAIRCRRQTRHLYPRRRPKPVVDTSKHAFSRLMLECLLYWYGWDCVSRTRVEDAAVRRPIRPGQPRLDTDRAMLLGAATYAGYTLWDWVLYPRSGSDHARDPQRHSIVRAAAADRPIVAAMDEAVGGKIFLVYCVIPGCILPSIYLVLPSGFTFAAPGMMMIILFVSTMLPLPDRFAGDLLPAVMGARCSSRSRSRRG